MAGPRESPRLAVVAVAAAALADVAGRGRSSTVAAIRSVPPAHRASRARALPLSVGDMRRWLPEESSPLAWAVAGELVGAAQGSEVREMAATVAGR